MQVFISERGGTVRPATFAEWGEWFGRGGDVSFEDGGRRVAKHELPGGVEVSTVCLGQDYAPFETMIFGGPREGYQERYETWDEAKEGHARALALAKGENN